MAIAWFLFSVTERQPASCKELGKLKYFHILYNYDKKFLCHLKMYECTCRFTLQLHERSI